MNGLEYILTHHSDILQDLCEYYNKRHGSMIYAMSFFKEIDRATARLLVENFKERPIVVSTIEHQEDL